MRVGRSGSEGIWRLRSESSSKSINYTTKPCSLSINKPARSGRRRLSRLFGTRTTIASNLFSYSAVLAATNIRTYSHIIPQIWPQLHRAQTKQSKGPADEILQKFCMLNINLYSILASGQKQQNKFIFVVSAGRFAERPGFAKSLQSPIWPGHVFLCGWGLLARSRYRLSDAQSRRPG